MGVKWSNDWDRMGLYILTFQKCLNIALMGSTIYLLPFPQLLIVNGSTVPNLLKYWVEGGIQEWSIIVICDWIMKMLKNTMLKNSKYLFFQSAQKKHGIYFWNVLGSFYEQNSDFRKLLKIYASDS